MDDSVTQTGLVVVLVGDEYRIDSRLIARGIELQHESLMKTLRTYQAGLEKYGKVRFEIGSSGKTNQKQHYALLNKEQVGYLFMFVRVTDIVRAFRELVYDRFLETEAKLAGPNREISDRLAVTSEHLESRILDGYWAIITELHREVRLAEVLGKLDGGAFPEKSVGRLWAKYARLTLAINVDALPTYLHYDPASTYGKEFPARMYPLSLLQPFRRWFSAEYLPFHCDVYVVNRRLRVERKERQIAASSTHKHIG